MLPDLDRKTILMEVQFTAEGQWDLFTLRNSFADGTRNKMQLDSLKNIISVNVRERAALARNVP